mmetsp:Transcript_691/g.2198  ORF Transcript_691/g.2198 Transcript_691/m.2198 type:complete len:353 (-) Transcript_691:59-1117(-)
MGNLDRASSDHDAADLACDGLGQSVEQQPVHVVSLALLRRRVSDEELGVPEECAVVRLRRGGEAEAEADEQQLLAQAAQQQHRAHVEAEQPRAEADRDPAARLQRHANHDEAELDARHEEREAGEAGEGRLEVRRCARLPGDGEGEQARQQGCGGEDEDGEEGGTAGRDAGAVQVDPAARAEGARCEGEVETDDERALARRRRDEPTAQHLVEEVEGEDARAEDAEVCQLEATRRAAREGEVAVLSLRLSVVEVWKDGGGQLGAQRHGRGSDLPRGVVAGVRHARGDGEERVDAGESRVTAGRRCRLGRSRDSGTSGVHSFFPPHSIDAREPGGRSSAAFARTRRRSVAEAH